MTENEIYAAIRNQTILRDFDGETGTPVEAEWEPFSGDTLAVRIVGENFSRWTDSLDLAVA